MEVGNTLLRANGSVIDLETSLFEADYGTPERSLAAARESYSGRPGNVFAADALAWALHASGRDAEAMQYADAALAFGVRPASFRYHRGMIAASLGNDDMAVRDLRAALEVNPYFSVAHAEIARTTLARLEG